MNYKLFYRLEILVKIYALHVPDMSHWALPMLKVGQVYTNVFRQNHVKSRVNVQQCNYALPIFIKRYVYKDAIRQNHYKMTTTHPEVPSECNSTLVM